jgi:hypothetical protein
VHANQSKSNIRGIKRGKDNSRENRETRHACNANQQLEKAVIEIILEAFSTKRKQQVNDQQLDDIV